MALPKWAWALIALLVACVVGLIALAGAGIYFVTREVRIQRATAASAEEAFDRERARFSNQHPLLVIRDDDVVWEGEQVESSTTARRPDALHVLVFDPDDERLVRIHVPFWLLRWSRHGTLRLSSDEFDLRRLKLTVEDLERMGPALLLDHRERDGTRVLLWSE